MSEPLPEGYFPELLGPFYFLVLTYKSQTGGLQAELQHYHFKQ